MQDRESSISDAAFRRREAVWRVGIGLLLVMYALGLTREINEPWIGLHDWNGAYYSQLARNLLRYPFEIHHGMPVMAVGPETPPPEERSIYATHPAGLAWLLAVFFFAGGEAEWVARLAPIAASLATVPLFCSLVRRRYGQTTALVVGLIYILMPMPVYFGRMVNHEAICLFLMIAALAALRNMIDPATTNGRRRLSGVLCAALIVTGIAMDWPGALFAAVLSIYCVLMWRSGRIRSSTCVLVGMASVLGCAAMLSHVVYAGLGGWGILMEVFFSRREILPRDATSTPWAYTVDNVTVPVLALALVGLLAALRDSVLRRRNRMAGGVATNPPAFVCLLAVTGSLWLFVFWRQYVVHQYWMYYLGPVIAWLAARGLLRLSDAADRFGPAVSWGVFVTALILVAWFGKIGVNEYFQRISCPMVWIESWKDGQLRVPPNGRALIPGRPIVIEEHGGYRFRNIVPPQMAYYLDRAITVVPAEVTATPATKPVGLD